MFFLTTIGLPTKGLKFERQRCVGYFKTFEAAQEVVLENIGDIYECGYYEYAVIEKIEAGLYKHDLKPTWYKAETDDGRTYDVKKIDAPDFAKNVCGWAIG